MPLGVAREAPARFVQRGLEADAGERVEQGLPLQRRVAHPGSGDDPQPSRPRSVDPAAVLALAAWIEVAPDFGKETLGPEVGGEDHQVLWLARTQSDQPLPEVGELRGSDGARVLSPFGVTERQQPAEVFVSRAILAEQRHPAGALDVELGADQRPDSLAAGDRMEARDAVQTADVRETEDGMSGGGRGVREILRQRGTAEKRERAPGMELDVVAGDVGPARYTDHGRGTRTPDWTDRVRALVAREHAKRDERGPRGRRVHQITDGAATGIRGHGALRALG